MTTWFSITKTQRLKERQQEIAIKDNLQQKHKKKGGGTTKDGRKKVISLASDQTRTNTEQRDGVSKCPAIYPACCPIRSSDMPLTSVSPLFAPLQPVYTANFTLHPDAGLFIFFAPHTFRFSLAYKFYTSPSVSGLLRVGIKKKVIRYKEQPSRFSYRCESSGDSCTVHSR